MSFNQTTNIIILEDPWEKTACSLSKSDTSFVLISSLLVMLMTPAMGFIYAGLVNPSGLSSTLGMCFAIFSLSSIIWANLGYTLVFGDSLGGFIGDFRYIFMQNILSIQNKCLNKYSEEICSKKKHYWENCGIPEFIFFFFQNKFAGITPVIIMGGACERMYLKYILIFISLWILMVYCPITHWLWNEAGFLFSMGVRDFAGGLVVHISSGFSALVASLVMGRRRNNNRTQEIVNFPLIIIGMMLLWFGWFGFNGGNSYAIGLRSIYCVISTNLSACTSLFVWIFADLIYYKKITALTMGMGALSGLVAITSGAGYISPQYSFIFGFISGSMSWFCVFYRRKLKSYDEFDIFSCHGISGIIGVILTGLLANKNVDPYLPYNGLIFAIIGGDENKLFIVFQIVSILIVSVYSFVVTYVILWTLNKLFKIRVLSNEEVYFDQINLFNKYTQEMKKLNVEVIR